MNTENIKNLVLDFGGVIYQIDFERQKKAFSTEGVGSFNKLYSQAIQNSLFCDLETGHISDDTFREKLLGLTGNIISANKIDSLWNSILVDYYHAQVDFVKKLKSKYRLFILSNTNSIHYNFYSAQFINYYGFDFNDLFEKTYWSFRIGLRKPEREIFEKVIIENGLTRENALFIDDTIQNTMSAEKYGLSSCWLQPGMRLNDLFDNDLRLIL